MSLNVCEYFRYGVSYRNFCLLGIFFEVQSVKSPRARGELAHTMNTPELSRIAKKVLVTIPRRSSADRDNLTSRARTSSEGHHNSAGMPDDNSRGGNNTRCTRAERRLGRSYRTETGTEAGHQNSRHGLGPEVGQGPRRKWRTKESATFSFGADV